EDQVFGVHAAPIIAVYGVNDMAPWGHMYVNPGLTEPFLIPVPEKSLCIRSHNYHFVNNSM
ncbi:hypothetical protein, partial [Collinsella sp. HCP28S3_H5]|uniref:hypothetical protein n=1 Tax=Collinsella sp. HCP28S3_H5 TaxID=3438928 RepID=UPI003F8B18F3